LFYKKQRPCAQPGASLYARKVAAMDSDAPELRDVSQLPARKRRIGKLKQR
jgi:hypothetical protein